MTFILPPSDLFIKSVLELKKSEIVRVTDRTHPGRNGIFLNLQRGPMQFLP